MIMESPSLDSGSKDGVVGSPHSGHVRHSPQHRLPVPTCPVRALRCYRRFMKDHQELRKCRQHTLLIPIKDNNSSKELTAATNSGWICNITVEPHAALDKSKSLPKTIKSHEVCSVATSL